MEGTTVTINSNRFVGIFFLVLGLFIFLAIPYQIAEGRTQYGPRLFPQFVSILIIVCSLGVLYQDFKTHKRQKKIDKNAEQADEEEKAGLFKPKELLRALIMFIIMTVYIWMMNVIGFLPSSLLFGTATLIFYKVRRWHYYAIVLGLTEVIYLLFRFILTVQLP
jgi:putative tricarboxylic transport membrane protein